MSNTFSFFSQRSEKCLPAQKWEGGLEKGFSKECKIGACKQLYSYLKIQIKSHVREK